MPIPTFWNQNVDKMTKKHSKWVGPTSIGSLLVMIYNRNTKFGG